jgi:choline dehydrogenase
MPARDERDVTESYDYVVVGGGSAGCVLAARLSEQPDARVLLLEAGPADRRPEIDAPAAWVTLLGGELDWGYLTEPQADAAGRPIYWPRGRVLGGSSCLNALVYMRGLPSDYDAWAAAGCPGWEWERVLPAFRALEDFPGGDPRLRGAGGPLRIRVPRERNPLSEAAREAALALGHAWNEDLNGARLEGVGWNQLTVADGVRQSAAAAFLAPALGRANLTVRTGALARRLVLDGARVRAVEYVADGQARRAEVAGEAIVCAGAIESPKLLMLSGVGPAAHLRELGIAVAADLPGVGANLHDHPGVGVTFATRRPIPPAANQYSELGIFCRTESSLAEPDLQYGVLHVPVVAQGFPAPTQDSAFTLYPSCLKPRSRGSLRLRSASPADAPLVDPAYLREEADRRVLLRSIEISRELAHAPGLREWTLEEILPGPQTTGEADLRGYLAQAVDTWFHPVGTCRMGTDEGAVVDPQLRVHGVEGLRVADASVMPEITSGNTNAPTLMLAWRAAELIAPAIG